MSDETRRELERYIQKRLRIVERLITRGRYEDAMKVLNKVDSRYPNRKDVLDVRYRCLRKGGKKLFEDLREEKEKASTASGGDSVSWSERGEDWRPTYPHREHAPVSPPTLVAYDPTDYHDSKIGSDVPKESRSALANVLWALLLLIYGIVLLQVLVPGLRAGEIREFGGMEFVWIPPTSADTSPRPDGTGGGTLKTDGFWLGRFEVTQAEWVLLMEKNPSYHHGDDNPVDSASAEEVTKLLDRLNRLGEGTFRLPTDAEWDWASLGGARTFYDFGDGSRELDTFAWYSVNSDARTHAVGEKEPSAWGLYDIYGNVAEWCTVGERYAYRSEPGVIDSAPEQAWILKGGSAREDADRLTSLNRSSVEDIDQAVIGLRLLREPGKSSKEVIRAIHFPEEYSLGELRVGGRFVALATGVVEVRVDEKLTLEFSEEEEAREHWEDLASLPPDSLYGLVATDLQLSNDELSYLSRLEALEVLDLSGNPLTDAAFRHLARLTSLRILTMAHTKIAGFGLRELVKADALQYLDISHSEWLSDSAPQAIEQLSSLRDLNVEECGFTEEQLLHLQVSLPHCTIMPDPGIPTPEQSLLMASAERKYAMLLEQFLDQDAYRSFGFFAERGRMPGSYYRDVRRPAGYWVYVRPYWYIWAGLKRDYSKRMLTARRRVDWGAKNAAGEPDVEELTGEHSAWAPGRSVEESNWLMLEFERPVDPLLLRVHVTKRALNISKIVALSLTGEEITAWPPKEEVKGKGETEFRKVGSQWVIELALTPDWTRGKAASKTARLRLYIDDEAERNVNTDAPTTRIDAVELLSRSGSAQWARAAFATSRYTSDYTRTDSADGSAYEEAETFIDPTEIHFRGFYGIMLDLADGEARRSGGAR